MNIINIIQGGKNIVIPLNNIYFLPPVYLNIKNITTNIITFYLSNIKLLLTIIFFNGKIKEYC